jgi:hypothetical protein
MPLEEKKADGPSATDNCPVCGSEGQDLMNGQADSIACQACGITYAPSEIKAQASKEETIKKIAELNKVSEVKSPWAIVVDPTTGKECIARVGLADKNVKESEEDIKDNLVK